MSVGTHLLLLALVLTNLALLGSSRLRACIRSVAIQGVLLGFLALFSGVHASTLPTIFLATCGAGLKGIVFPWLLSRALREAGVRREVEPYVGYSLSLLIGVLFLGISLWLGAKLSIPEVGGDPWVVPVAFFSILTGLFLIVGRRTALFQVLGYLVMENGIYAFGIALVHEEPFLVEMGIFLDIFVAVFVMGITMFHINREFDHIETDRLSELRDVEP